MRFLRQFDLRPLEWLGLILVAALVFVWPIPGTIALRNVLVLMGIAVWLAIWIRSAGTKPPLSALKLPLLWYAALTAWLLVGAFLVSVDTQLSLLELKGQWLRSALAGFLGILLATWTVRPGFDADKARLCVLVIVVPLALQVLLTLADTLLHWLLQESQPSRASKLISGKLDISFNVNVLLAIVAADLLGRARKADALIPVPGIGLFVLIAAGIATTYFLHSRNGTVCLAALSMICLALYLRHGSSGRKARVPIMILAIFVAVATTFTIQADHRWLTFQESVSLGWKTEEHRAWLDSQVFPLPRLKDGKPVQHSAFMRTAWTKESFRVLAENPLGMGFMRGAMGRAFHEKYGHGLGGHADNGLIDFSLGAGLPGTFLGAGLLTSLLMLGWKVSSRLDSSIGMALFLVVLGYAMRTLVDSTTRDHFLEQFLFMSALFATLAAALLDHPRQVAAPA
jgi:hypothetical protein